MYEYLIECDHNATVQRGKGKITHCALNIAVHLTKYNQHQSVSDADIYTPSKILQRRFVSSGSIRFSGSKS